jgi:transcriptional regulator with XRE-family HTH domain
VASSDTQKRKLDSSAAFGQLLRTHRLRQKMSQEALAASPATSEPFSLIELGKTNPSLLSIFDICGSLRVKPFVFLREVEKLSNFELPLDKS